MSLPSLPDARGATDRNALRIAIALLAGGVTVILASTTVSVALHGIALDLDVGVGTVQWVVTAYLLALCVAIPLVAWLQGLVGGRRLWMGGLVLFLLGSVLCSAAWDAPSLIAARVVQGLGGGVITPLLTTILMQATPEPDRPRLTSIVAVSTAVGPILGPVIGGLVLGVADWRWLFLLNVPLCLVGLGLAWRLVPPDDAGPRVRLDVVGLLLLPPALVGLLWGLSNVTDSAPWRGEMLGPIAVGLALLVAFVAWAVHRRGRALVDLRVLRFRSMWAAAALLFLSGAALHGALLLLPLYWQQVRGADALGAGLLLIPQGLGSLASRTVAVRLMAVRGGRVVSVLGFLLVAGGTVPFVFADAGTSTWVLMVALLVRGLGIGIVVVPLFTVAFAGLQRDEMPHASIVIRISQQMGGAVGVALLAVVLGSVTTATGSLTTGFAHAFSWAAGFAGLAMLLSGALPGVARRAGGGPTLR